MVNNLLSIGKLTGNGFEVLFRQNTCEIYENYKQIAVADSKEGLYELRITDKINVSISGIHDWHQRLVHRYPKAFRKIKAEGLIERMKIVECGIFELCDLAIV